MEQSFQKLHIQQETIDQVNQACYDNRAYLWDRFPFQNILPDLVHKYYIAQLGNRVLDVGAGTGVLAKWLVDEGFDVLCLDPSKEMVRRCREKKLTIIQSSIQNYQPDEGFAMIFAILSLIHVPKDDFAEQIDKLARALPANGILFLGMLQGRGEGIFEGPDFPRFFAYYQPEEILQVVKPAFTLLAEHGYYSGSVGYMLFALKKNRI
jgi:2-polyprenyl-3-methyl-5-hydroxy-6-metoxy-1,4-benzoquinol methylase